MSEQYLWDRSGPVDLEIARLERALSPLAHRPGTSRSSWMRAAAAAVLVLAAATALLMRSGPARSDWRLAGEPTRSGQTLRTGQQAVTLEADDIGQVEVAPASELTIVGRGNLRLERGTLHAFIWAPPRQFVVDTPAARAVDLGCQYTLSVDPGGDGMLRVQTGWVAFQHGPYESFVPAGAACRTYRNAGPGLPYFEDASPAFVRGVELRDSRLLLAEARPRDGLTLWHLLTRSAPEQRGAIFDRLAELVTLPRAANREAVLAGKAQALDAAWDALGLDSASWWREWKRRW